jgi:hypothetical protein
MSHIRDPERRSNKDVAGGYVGLDVNGTIPVIKQSIIKQPTIENTNISMNKIVLKAEIYDLIRQIEYLTNLKQQKLNELTTLEGNSKEPMIKWALY